MEKDVHELIIIGGGPAGASAAIYAGRKQLKTLLITEAFGGQSVVSEGIKNWIGEKEIPGFELANRFKEHVEEYSDYIDIEYGLVNNISKNDDGTFLIKTADKEFKSKTILISSGSGRRKLDIKGAEEFENKGIVYCASCDGPLFQQKDVVVVGGGNAGFETAIQLLEYAKSVTLLHRSNQFKADQITVNKVLENEKFTGILNADIKEIYGGTLVEGIKYFDKNKDEEIDLKTNGVFVEIGLTPNTSFINEIEKDDFGRIKIDKSTKRTSIEGIWAAGDCTDSLFHQNNIAAGDGIIALEDIFLSLRK